jgi:hypothetical protein
MHSYSTIHSTHSQLLLSQLPFILGVRLEEIGHIILEVTLTQVLVRGALGGLRARGRVGAKKCRDGQRYSFSDAFAVE